VWWLRARGCSPRPVSAVRRGGDCRTRGEGDAVVVYRCSSGDGVFRGERIVVAAFRRELRWSDR